MFIKLSLFCTVIIAGSKERMPCLNSSNQNILVLNATEVSSPLIFRINDVIEVNLSFLHGRLFAILSNCIVF